MDWFIPNKPKRLLVNQPCTSWYGHAFQKFDENNIYCPHCGTTKRVTA